MSHTTDLKKPKERFWKPQAGPQETFLENYYVDEILYGGAKGGGKTDVLLWDFIDEDVIKKPHYRGIIFRRTFPRLIEIVDRSLKWFKGRAEYLKGERSWVFPSGAKLYFRHCQYEESKYDYQGHEYHYMGFDQLEEFTEKQYEFLTVQCRTTDPDIHIRLRGTANPGNVGHLWVKRRFIDNKIPMKVYNKVVKTKMGDKVLTSMFIPAKIYDNPILVENDPLYLARLESLPEEERKALLEGDWNIFAGQYFKEWNRDVHVIEPFYIPKLWKRFIAGDYGMKKPSSIGWYAVSPEGEVIRYKEIYKEGLHYDKLAEEICESSKDEEISYAVFDPAIFGDKQHHKEAKEGFSGAEIMQQTIDKWFTDNNCMDKRFSVVRADNRRIEGWRNLKQQMRVYEYEGGLTSDFKVFSTCTKFVTIFPANTHDTHKPEDLNTDGEDHNADEARYAIMSRPPKTDLHQEKVYSPTSVWGRRLARQAKKDGFKYGRD